MIFPHSKVSNYDSTLGQWRDGVVGKTTSLSATDTILYQVQYDKDGDTPVTMSLPNDQVIFLSELPVQLERQWRKKKHDLQVRMNQACWLNGGSQWLSAQTSRGMQALREELELLALRAEYSDTLLTSVVRCANEPLLNLKVCVYRAGMHVRCSPCYMSLPDIHACRS